MPFVRVSASRLAAAYRDGRTSPYDVAERALAAAEASQAHSPPLQAFIDLKREDVRTQARASAERWEAGAPLGALDGIPVAIKDAFDVAGYRTTDGTGGLRNAPIAGTDATVVQRLRAAGAIIFGKTNLHEVGMGGTGINPHYGTPRNPYDPDCIPGGSSSGSAAVVSSGICPLALGSDAGGSIRIPAALCGVYGIKPTFGRIPATGGKLLAWSLDHLGPLGASIPDLHAFLVATSGPDGIDAAATPQPAISELGTASLKGARFAYCPTFGMDGEPEVVGAFQEVITRLRAAGAVVDSVELELAEHIQRLGYLTLAAEGATSQRELLNADREAVGCDVRLLLSVGNRVTAVEYLHGQRVRRAIRYEFEALLQGYDAFLNPTCAGLAAPLRKDALKLGEVDDAVNGLVSAYTFAGNLTGQPALSIPIGAAQRGPVHPLPIGLQLMGKAWSEGRLLELGQAMAHITDPMPRPQVHYDILGR